MMSSLASLLPAFLKRKRSPEEEEQRKLRAALNVLSRSAVVDACIKLHEANVAHKQRIGELEQAVVARSGAVECNIRAWMRDDLAIYAPLAPTVVTTKTDASTQLDRMLSLQPVELHREASNLFAVSSHEPEAAYWRKSDVSYKSPRVQGDEPISFWNLRDIDIGVLCINYDGNDAYFLSSTVKPGRLTSFTTRPHHGWRIYDAESLEFLGGVYVKAAPYDNLPWNEGHPWCLSPLRTVFGFDGFVGRSLRDVLAAVEAAPPEMVKTTQSFCENRYLVVVA